MQFTHRGCRAARGAERADSRGMERVLEDHELFAWLADASGTIRAAEPTFTRLCGADPAGQALAALANPIPPREPPAATLIEHTAADGGRFRALVFTLPVGAGVLGVGL